MLLICFWVNSLFTQSGSDIITLNYATQKGNCTEEVFTCRLKDLPQLQNYIYSYNSVTVRTSLESESSVSHCFQLQSAFYCFTIALNGFYNLAAFSLDCNTQDYLVLTILVLLFCHLIVVIYDVSGQYASTLQGYFQCIKCNVMFCSERNCWTSFWFAIKYFSRLWLSKWRTWSW